MQGGKAPLRPSTQRLPATATPRRTSRRSLIAPPEDRAMTVRNGLRARRPVRVGAWCSPSPSGRACHRHGRVRVMTTPRATMPLAGLALAYHGPQREHKSPAASGSTRAMVGHQGATGSYTHTGAWRRIPPITPSPRGAQRWGPVPRLPTALGRTPTPACTPSMSQRRGAHAWRLDHGEARCRGPCVCLVWHGQAGGLHHSGRQRHDATSCHVPLGCSGDAGHRPRLLSAPRPVPHSPARGPAAGPDLGRRGRYRPATPPPALGQARGAWPVAPARSTCHRPRLVRHARAPPVPRHVQGLRPRSASTEACLARHTAFAGGQNAVAVLRWCAPRGQALTQGPCSITLQTLARREERPQRTSDTSGTAADLQERSAIRRAPWRGLWGGRNPRHGQSAAAPVPSFGTPRRLSAKQLPGLFRP